mmetsp:Transcript_9791/g.17871  ORF Transcript_9791/g.17871 Transcript_9791/m.17871 type:complete len:907 (+) Transcript_9791:219-2939(+)
MCKGERCGLSARKLYDRYFWCLSKGKYLVMAWWVIVLGLGCGFGLQFLGAVDIEIDAPKGTDGYTAQHKFDTLFKERATQQSYLLYFECGGDCYGYNSAVNNRTYFQLQTIINAAKEWKDGYVVGNQSWWGVSNHTEYKALKSRFLSAKNNKAMIAIVSCKKEKLSSKIQSFVRHVRKAIDKVKPHDGTYIGFLGGNTILADSVTESSTTITEIDAAVLPLALLVLMYVVQSWRMVIIPLFNVATCLLSSFAIMYALTTVTTKAPSFVPSVMEALVIALSIDYSLFLLTRYRYELMKNDRTTMDAVYHAMWHAGEVVVMSGLTLILCFLGMIGFPTQTVYMIGVGCSLCLFMALLINLTMTPALLLTFPKFFSTFQFLPWCFKVQRGKGEDGERVVFDDVDSDATTPHRYHQPAADAPQRSRANNKLYMLVDESYDETNATQDSKQQDATAYTYREDLKQHQDDRANFEKSYWYRSTAACIKWPYVLLTILLPLALISPAAYRLLEFKYSLSTNQISPRESPSMHAMHHIQKAFPLGLMTPLYVIVDSETRNKVKSERYFSAVSRMSHLVINNTSCKKSDVNSVGLVNGVDISWAMAAGLIKTNAMGYGSFFNSSTNNDFSASLITITTPFQPFDDEISSFTDKVRGLFKDHGLPSDFKFYLAGPPIWTVDATRQTFSLFPWIIVAIVVAIFLMISLLLRSAFVPLRYAFTLVFPLSFIFGLAVLVYQEGALEWLGWDAVRSTDGLFWFTPIITFPVCLGLALDYDIFLVCRIAEYRTLGFTNKAAILKAVYETGGIITAAGIIMAIAFGGMLFSTTDALNQIGWILFSSVLFDTFVVRTILVPAVISLAGNANWWPRKIPMAGLKDEFGDFAAGHEGGGRLLSIDSASVSTAGAGIEDNQLKIQS